MSTEQKFSMGTRVIVHFDQQDSVLGTVQRYINVGTGEPFVEVRLGNPSWKTSVPESDLTLLGEFEPGAYVTFEDGNNETRTEMIVQKARGVDGQPWFRLDVEQGRHWFRASELFLPTETMYKFG